MDETTVTIETPTIVPEIVPVVTDTPNGEVLPVAVDLALLVGELKAKLDLLEISNGELKFKTEMLESTNTSVLQELNVLRELTKVEAEIIEGIEDTPEDELPIETLPEIEIIPEIVPEVEQQVVKRKRFWV